MKIGFVSLALSGHLNPMTSLARQMQVRGNDIVFIAVPEAEPVVRAAGLNFVPFCEKEYPIGTVAKIWGEVAERRGLDVVRHSCSQLLPGLVQAGLEHLEQTIAQNGVEALVLDTIYFFLELVPIHLGLPYAHVWNVLNLDLSGSTPPFFFSWPCETTPEAHAQNMDGVMNCIEMMSAIVAPAIAYAEKVGLQVDWNTLGSTNSPFAIVSQIPKEFDFPNIPWPAQFHHTGPFHGNAAREPVSFPWEKLTGEPLVYASMGTLVNGLESVYADILEVVGAIPEVQLVLSVGNNIDPKRLEPLPSNAIVVRKAPQLELLKRASLCITHAGLNTAMECLAQGVPMVAIPVGYDQPGVASRIAYHGVGEFVDILDLTVERLAELVDQVRKDPSYGEKARYFQKVIAETNGLDRAARAIEQAFGISNSRDAAVKKDEYAHA